MELHEQFALLTAVVRENSLRVLAIEKNVERLLAHLTQTHTPGRPKGTYAKYETLAARVVALLRNPPPKLRPKRVDSVWLAEALYPELPPLRGRHRMRSMLRKLVAQERILRSAKGRHVVLKGVK